MSVFELDAARENRNADRCRKVDITPFVSRLRFLDRKAEQAEIDAANARIGKAEALLETAKKLNHLVKMANKNGKPPWLIIKALKAQMGLVRELCKLRGNQ